MLSLKQDHLRRDHIIQHFADVGIANFEFFEAVSYNSEEVKECYRKGLVKGYPGCFRCLEDVCECQNNIIIPQQVANWLSFLNIWRSLKNEDGLFLICEDDVAFHKNAISLLNRVLSDLGQPDDNLLIRLVASGNEPNRVLDLDKPLEIFDTVAMSNAAYIVSGSMIRYLLGQFQVITHTSDVWVHQQIASHVDVRALTVNPLIGTDLSFNKEYAKFISRIHPKGVDESDILRADLHRKRAGSLKEYEDLLAQWGI